jgi:ketopantoate reductase
MDCDAVIVTVKSYDTAEILTVQNGIQAFDILKSNIKDSDCVFAGVTYIGASRIDEEVFLLDTIYELLLTPMRLS